MRYFLFNFLTAFCLIGTPSLHAVINDADNPVFVKDTVSENIVAVWTAVDQTTGNALIQSAIRSSLTSTWSSPVTISDTAMSVSNIPELAINAAGNIVAVWLAIDFNTSLNTTNVATLPLAGTLAGWSSPLQISLADEDAISNEHVFIDSTGIMFVIWSTRLDGETSTSIQVARGTFDGSGGTWASPINISS